MTTKPKLAKKQAEVLGLLEGGKTPVEVAKKLGISPNGVYGHMRRIEAKGYAVPRGKSNASPAKAKRRGRPKASSNGSGPVGAIDAGIKKLIQQAETRSKAIKVEADKITAEQNVLKDRLARLGAEQNELVSRREALAAAQK